MRDSSIGGFNLGEIITLNLGILNGRICVSLQADGVAAADEGEDAKCEESCLHGKIEDFKLVL